MRRKAIVFSMVFFILLTSLLPGCSNPHDQLGDSMEGYTRMLEGDLPENLRLTIYYMSTAILTYVPLSAEDLIRCSNTSKIVIEADELATNLGLLKKVDASILQPVQEESYINARLYYVFEVGDSEKLLEVTVTPTHLDKIYGHVVVNGIEVEDNPIFYELIIPFLTEDAHNALGI